MNLLSDALNVDPFFVESQSDEDYIPPRELTVQTNITSFFQQYSSDIPSNDKNEVASSNTEIGDETLRLQEILCTS